MQAEALGSVWAASLTRRGREPPGSASWPVLSTKWQTVKTSLTLIVDGRDSHQPQPLPPAPGLSFLRGLQAPGQSEPSLVLSQP